MASSTAVVKPLRSTGNFERYNIARNYIGYYTSVGGTATYSIPPRLFAPHEKGEVSFETIVLTALGKTVERHAPLGVGVKGEETLTPEWIRLGSNKSKVKWGEVVEFLDIDGEGDEWVEDTHQLVFERVEELPLWKVRVTKPIPEQDGRIRFKVGFFFHHAIGDGISGGAFHIAFRNALNGILAGTIKIENPITTEDEIIFSPTLELLPNMERAHKLPISFSFMLRLMIENFVYRKDDPTHWKGPAIPQKIMTPRHTHLKSFSLDKDTTARLVQYCREEKTTVTALTCYIIARQLAVMYPDHTRFSGLVPFSFRRFTNTPDDEMVLQVTTNPVRFTRNPNDHKRYIYTESSPPSSIDWEAIRCLKKSIDVKIKPSDSLVGMLKWAGDLQKYLRGRQGTKRDVSFELSNIGVVDGGAAAGIGKGGDEGVCFERFMFSACIACVAAPYSFCLASAKGGDLTMVLSWEEGVMAREEAEALLGGLEGGLRRVAVKKEV